MVRQTKQRTAVIEVLRAARSHPDAAWIHSQVREQLPNVSLGTVYRTLDALVRDGIIMTIERAGQATRYDYKHPDHPHDHAVCTVCNTIFDVVVPGVPTVTNDCLPQGFQVKDLRLELRGVCASCRAKEQEE